MEPNGGPDSAGGGLQGRVSARSAQAKGDQEGWTVFVE
jgi:hypothetical protein